MPRPLAALPLFFLLLSPVWSAESKVSDPHAQLVDQLGDDSYEVRERAAKQLIELGLDAKDALLQGTHHFDVEVRTRCTRIWSKVQVLDLEKRLAAFLKDPDNPTANFAGWSRYRKLLGDDRPARELFVDMQRSEPGLLDAMEKSTKAAGEMVAILCREYQQHMIMRLNGRREEVPLGSVAALVFVGSQPELKLDIQSASMIYNFVNQQAFQRALQGGAFQQHTRKLLGLWVGRPAESHMAYQSMMLAMRFDLKEGLEPALKMVRDGGTNASQRAYAVVAVGKLGGKAHVEDIKKLLDNQSVCATYQVNNKRITTQLRDVALAVAVHLTGQSLEQYGYNRVQRNQQMLFYPYSLGFEESSQRDKAFAKWRQWEASRVAKGG